MQKSRLFIFSVLASVCMSPAFAAKPVDLKHQPISILNSLTGISSLKEVSRVSDFNKTEHTRLVQLFSNVPVFAADVVVHQYANDKNVKLNGLIYQELEKDLGAKPALTSEKIVKHAISLFQKASNNMNPVSETKSDLIVFVDDKNKAHWSYLVSFLVSPAEGLPAKPTYIIDATSQQVYLEWDNIQTREAALGGGFGGNTKMGKMTFDGLDGNLPKLDVNRDASAEVCTLKNSDVTVKDRRYSDQVVKYTCTETDPDHDNIWWNADHDAVNGGYSPSNDALYAGRVIQDMYLKWYGVPALVDSSGNKLMLNMRVHERMDNAYWDGYQMTFGDGISMFYPLVSLGVGAHEISHGFTEQHSGLYYSGQSGGLNEAFSDMAAQAAEFYSVGKNSWEIGPEIMKGNGALRYMIQPSKDCNGGTPGNWCSIDHVSQYKSGLDVHYSSGIFNRVFYLIGSAEGWDTKKAFDIMVQANQFYWTPFTSWIDAACGVLKATADYQYDASAVKSAFATVGVDISNC